MTLVDDIGGKEAGELIRSADWNELVTAVDALQHSLAELKKETGDRLDQLEQDLKKEAEERTAVQADLDALKTSIQPLTFRVTMQSDRDGYAIGEIAEVTATIASLVGAPVAASDADRPWVDFVATWGQLRAADGFESLGGEGDRMMSVRADAQGTAKVLLVADHLEGFSPDVQNEVAASLQTQLPTNLSVAQSFLTAATPTEAKNAGAMQVMATEYDRADASSVRSFVDAYHLRASAVGTAALSPTITPGFRDFQAIWQDHRATVLAFASTDDNATTPDQSRGIGAVTLTFRDWIRPWITLQYLDPTVLTTMATGIQAQLAQKIGTDYAASIGAVRDEVDSLVGQGVLRRQRDYAVVRQALDGVAPPAPVPYEVLSLTKPLQDSLVMQQTLDTVQLSAPAVTDDRVALDVFSNAASRGDAAAAGVGAQLGGQLSQLQEAVQQAQEAAGKAQQAADDATSGIGNLRAESIAQLQSQVSELSGKFDVALSDNGPVGRIDQRLTTVETQANALQALNPTAVNEALGKISSLELSVRSLHPNG